MEETSKSKKTLKTLGIVIIALVVIFIALVAALGTGDSETAKNMTPEEAKTAAGEKDLEIARSVWSAQQYEVKLADKVHKPARRIQLRRGGKRFCRRPFDQS